MAPMDVEKRMGLSLDAIIKQSGKGKPGGGRDKGRGKPRDKKLVIGQKVKGRDQAKKSTTRERPGQSLSVQKKGLKPSKGGKRIAVAITQTRRDARGKKGISVKSGRNPRRAEPQILSRKGSKNAGREAPAKRTVDLPRLTDLRITISNERAAAPSQYPMPSVPAHSFQPHAYQSHPMYAPPSQAMQQPVYGFGPRNMQPREGLNRVVPEVPVPRARMDYGVSRKTLGADPYVARRAYKDFDDPNQNKSYMRMDTR